MNPIKLVTALALSFLLACGGTTTPPTASDAAPITEPCPDAAPPVVVADAGAPDVATDAPSKFCDGGSYSLVLREAIPAVVTLPHGTDTPWTVVVLKGCGFTGVRDVEVSVMSVPFTVIDDETIALSLPFWHAEDFGEPGALPTSVQIDVIKRQPDQAQIDIVFQ